MQEVESITVKDDWEVCRAESTTEVQPSRMEVSSASLLPGTQRGGRWPGQNWPHLLLILDRLSDISSSWDVRETTSPDCINGWTGGRGEGISGSERPLRRTGNQGWKVPDFPDGRLSGRRTVHNTRWDFSSHSCAGAVFPCHPRPTALITLPSPQPWDSPWSRPLV